MERFKNLDEIMMESEEIFDGQVVHLFKDTVELPNGMPATREVIRHMGAVGIVPMTEAGKVVMEEQFRYPLGRVVLEIPAGKLDSKEEDRLAAAKRELEEETGIVADEWIELGDYCPTAAICDEIITLYLAKGLHKGVRNLDEDEFLNIKEVPFDDLVEDILSGKIVDGKTQAAILKVAMRKDLLD